MTWWVSETSSASGGTRDLSAVSRSRNGPRTAAARLKSRLALPTHQATVPRPRSSSAPFRQSCHTSTTSLPGLQMGALTAGSVPRYQDPRRQPMDVPAVLGGEVPSWLPGASSYAGGEENTAAPHG